MTEPKAAELFTLPGVHIFSTGKWNGREHDEAFLDKLVESFAALRPKGVRPFLKLGHDDDQKLLQKEGLPAAGWIENVRRMGNKLYADFVDIPKKIYQLMLNKGYQKRSIEVVSNLELEGKTYDKFLFSIALLGNDFPAVHNIDDLLALYGIGLKHAGVEKFDAQGSPDILDLSNPDQKTQKEVKTMTTEKIDEVLKFKLEQATGENAALKTQLAELSASVAELKDNYKAVETAKTEAESKLAASIVKEKTAQVEKFATELLAEKLIPKSAEGLVKDLFSGKDKYSIGDKEATKEGVFKEILKLSKEAAKVNFKDATAAGKESPQDGKDLQAKIDAYKKENGVSDVEAYKAVTRGMKLDALPIGASADDGE